MPSTRAFASNRLQPALPLCVPPMRAPYTSPYASPLNVHLQSRVCFIKVPGERASRTSEASADASDDGGSTHHQPLRTGKLTIVDALGVSLLARATRRGIVHWADLPLSQMSDGECVLHVSAGPARLPQVRARWIMWW